MVLLFGDLFVLFLSLWLALFLRYLSMPEPELLYDHFRPFSFLFAVWLGVFFITGLYEKQTTVLKSKLPADILNAQVANAAVAVLFFYLIPYFEITPKTNLFIYLAISSGLLVLWRLYIHPLITPRLREKGILIGAGEEMKELREEINSNPKYGIKFVSSIDLDNLDALDFHTEIMNRIYSEKITALVIDLENKKIAPILPHLYNLIFSNIKFLDMHTLYEEIFDRIPVSLIRYNWFLENVSLYPKQIYDFFKRGMDIVLSLALGLLSLVFYPFVYLAVKLDDGGPVFITQNRMGKDNKVIKIVKFRSMSDDERDKEVLESATKITRVGRFLRKTRIDELPQLWNVLKGDVSLIGPRSELPALVKLYEEKIPYYNVRHLIKPGLSGWAQIKQSAPPKFKTQYDGTKVKLSYDLYYIKNRSFFLDLKIALQTIQEILSRKGV